MTERISRNRVLVTGGAGFIGSHLLDRLIKDQVDVAVLDDLSTGKLNNLREYLEDKKLRFIEGDIRDKASVNDALKDVEVVFHLAAVTSVPYSVEHPEETFEVNVDGMRNLLEISIGSDVERFVYVSTCALYGEPRYLPIDEKHLTHPISPYAESKLRAELVCQEFHESYGLKSVILRPFNVYGPGQRNDQYAGAISRFIERIREGKPPVVFGDGSQTRDFVHVTDVVEALLLSSRSKDAMNRIFNIATGVPTSINRLAQLLIEISGAGLVEPQYKSARKGDIKHSYADIKKAETYLGFRPQVSLKEGLADVMKVRK
jgi:nucleoside-diphosphate-sugar epimerase